MNVAKMETELFACSRKHFAQAGELPFTVAPLVSLSASGGFSKFGDAVLEGITDIDSLDIGPCAKLLLHNMKQTQTSMTNPPDPTEEDMNDCFQKWSEWTSTPPSNLHLSNCTALLKHLQKPKNDSDNQDSNDFPWHSSGQGVGDSPPWWIVVSSSLISACSSMAKTWTTHQPGSQEEAAAGIDAFVDDTMQVLAVNNKLMPDDLRNDMQMNSNLRNGLALATGGMLNQWKGCCSVFQWSFAPEKLPHLLEPGEITLDLTTLQTDAGKHSPM